MEGMAAAMGTTHISGPRTKPPRPNHSGAGSDRVRGTTLNTKLVTWTSAIFAASTFVGGVIDGLVTAQASRMSTFLEQLLPTPGG